MGRRAAAWCADNARQSSRRPRAPRRILIWNSQPARYFTEELECRIQLSAHIVGSSTVYTTIQAAVDAAAPSSVITVDAGTYSELVTVGKGLTLRGAQAGVAARTNARQAGTSESIVNGSTGASGQSSGF